MISTRTHVYTWNREHNTISLSFLFEQRKHGECKNVKNLNMQNYNHTCGLYECASWYPILRERHRLRVFENRVLWSIFGRKENKKFWEELIYLLSLRKSLIWSKKKVKQSRYTPWRRLGERRYSSYSFLTSALDRGEWSASRLGRVTPPGKGPSVPIGQEAGWTPEPVWTQRIEEKSFSPAGDRTPIARSSSP
jgi:hypothetical protein